MEKVALIYDLVESDIPCTLRMVHYSIVLLLSIGICDSILCVCILFFEFNIDGLTVGSYQCEHNGNGNRKIGNK